jgi:hypothetical protein
MDSKKTIIAVAVVAILVVAAACVFVFVLNKDKSADHYEALRDIKVEDQIKMDENLSIKTLSEKAGSGDEFLAKLYNTVGWTDPVGEATIKFQGKDYDCDVYERSIRDVTMRCFVVKTSGALLKADTTDGSLYIELISSDFDVATPISEHNFVEGASYQYNSKLKTTVLGYTEEFDSTVVYMITDVLDGGLKYSIDREWRLTSTEVKTLESIDGSVYKFKDDSLEYPKYGAMSYYSYSSAEKYLDDIYDDVKMGEKKTEKMETSYGTRNVTLQKVTGTIEVLGETIDTHYHFYYGEGDVLYQYSVLNHTSEDGESFTVIHTYTLKSCTAVSTV